MWLAAFGIFMLADKRKNDIPEHRAESTQNTVQSAKFTHYTARLSGKTVVIYEVYENGYEKAVSLPDISADSLTPQDRQSFEKGIILSSKEELASLIEDFTS